jgi:hypothetical protein
MERTYQLWSREAVDRNGCKTSEQKGRVKGETASRRAEGAPLTRPFCSEKR